MLYDLITLNIGTYLLAVIILPLVMILFWYIWCRDRVIVLGVIASIVIMFFYVFAVSILLYRYKDPAMMAAYGSVGLIDRKTTLSNYLESGFFRLGNENSWKVLPAINPEWESHLELMNREFLADNLAQSRSDEFAQRAVSVLDKIDPGWRNGEIGTRVARSIIKHLSNSKQLTDDDRNHLEFFEKFKLPSAILTNYLSEQYHSIEVVQYLSSVMDKIEPGWRNGEIGTRVAQNTFEHFMNGEFNANEPLNLHFAPNINEYLN